MTATTRLGRPVLLLVVALLVTRIGAAAAYVGVALEIWRATHSAAWETAAMVATQGLAGFVPLITSPIADRFDRRTVMVVSQALSAAAWLLLALHPSPVSLVVLGVASVVVESPFFVAVEASVPNLVPHEDALVRANSATALTFAASWLIGPILAAAVLDDLGVAAVFFFNAATSAVAAGVIWRIHAAFRSAPVEGAGALGPDEERRGSVLHGLRVVRSTPLLRALVGGWFLAMLGFQGANVVFAPLSEARGAGSLAYALGLVGWGLGLAVGAAAGGRMRAGSERAVLKASLVLAAVGLSCMGLAPMWGLTVLATATAGVGWGCAFVADSSLVQRATPDALRARVRAVIDGSSTLGGLGSMVLSGLVLGLAGPSASLVVGGVLVALGAVVVRSSGVRSVEPVAVLS